MKSTFKILSTVFVVMFSLQTGSSQLSFSHAGGGSYYLASDAAAPGVMYSPRLNFMEFGDMSLSIGTHAGLGFAISANSREGGSGSFALDLPVLLELNIGHANGVGSNSSFGGYLGAGYGISRIAYSDPGAYGSEGSNKAQGLVFNGGVRALIKDKPIDLRVSYMMNSKEGFFDVISAGVSYTLGDY